MRISDWSSNVCSSDRGRHCTVGCDRADDGQSALSADRRTPHETCRGLARAMGVPRRRCRLGGRQPCRHSQIARQNGSAFAKLAGLSPRSDRRIVPAEPRSEEHTSELQSLMRISYAVFCLKKKKTKQKPKNIR